MDPFAEVPPREKFDTLVNEIWPQRQEVPEISQNVNPEENLNPACKMELDTVIGRRGFDRRNNLKQDCKDRILYNSGSLMVFAEENDDPEVEQLTR